MIDGVVHLSGDGGAPWSMVVHLSGRWWCTLVVDGGAPWSMVVHLSGRWWCTLVVDGGAPWSMVWCILKLMVWCTLVSMAVHFGVGGGAP
jgi:hypothetical protein